MLSVFAAITVFVLFSFDKSVTTNNPSVSSNPTQKANVSPSPFPFQELTIPYLRSQQFTSYLRPLVTVSDNSEFKTTTTSYQSEGLNINGLLTIPKGGSPEGGWPAIVFVHGYIPPNEYRTTSNYAAYVNYLASRGFVVFKIDLRGHADSEGEPSGAYYSSDYVVDTLNAYSALQTSSFVNPDRIGLWGHSMAGNVVLRAIASNPSIPAGVIWAGAVYTYTDFQEYGIEDSSYQRPSEAAPRSIERQQLFDLYGQFNPESLFWQQVVATNYLDEVTSAIQLHHATNDPVVDIRYSQNLSKILSSKNITHELHEYSSGGHNLSGNTFNTAMSRTASFFDKYLNTTQSSN